MVECTCKCGNMIWFGTDFFECSSCEKCGTNYRKERPTEHYKIKDNRCLRCGQSIQKINNLSIKDINLLTNWEDELHKQPFMNVLENVNEIACVEFIRQIRLFLLKKIYSEIEKRKCLELSKMSRDYNTGLEVALNIVESKIK